MTILYSHSPIFASEEIGWVGQTDDAAWSERMRGSDLSSPGGEPAIRKFKNLKKKCIIPRAYPGTKVLSIIVNGGVLRWAIALLVKRVNGV